MEQHNNESLLKPIVTSLCYYALCICVGRVLRFWVRQKTSHGTFLQALLFDFVTSFQLMAMSLENGQIRIYYGGFAYMMILSVSGTYTYNTINEGTSNPCACVIGVMKGSYNMKQGVLRSLVQLAGGLLSHRFARMFWSLGLTASHWNRYVNMEEVCLSDLKVLPYVGFAIELVGTIINTLICLQTFSSFHRSENLAKCLFAAYLTLIGVDHTGMYTNPVNATNQTFGCHGPTFFEFFVVYWVAPLVGTVLSVWIYNALKPTLDRLVTIGQRRLAESESEVLYNGSDEKSRMFNSNGNILVNRSNFGQMNKDNNEINGQAQYDLSNEQLSANNNGYMKSSSKPYGKSK